MDKGFFSLFITFFTTRECLLTETTRFEAANHGHFTFFIWRHRIANRFLSLSRNLLTPSKRSSSPNYASPPPPKAAKPKHNHSQPRLTAIARQFFSPAELTGFKLIHGPVRCRLPLQKLRSNLRRLHINPRQILDIHYSDGNLISFLIHIGYEAELCSQLSKFNIKIYDDFDPLGPPITRYSTLINEPTDCKLQRARKSFLHRIYTALQRFRTPIDNAVANFPVQPGPY